MVLSHSLSLLELTLSLSLFNPSRMATNMVTIAYFTTVVIDLRIRSTITSLNFKIWKIWRPAACEDKKFFQNVYDLIQDVIAEL